MVHLAANTFVPDSYLHANEYYENNIASTLNALELCKLYKSKMIFASSYVYGHPKYLPIDESHPLEHFNPYASSKIICERLCEDFHNFFNLKVIILRIFNIFGKGQSELFLISKIFSQALKGKITLNDPEPRRDYLYIDDVIEAYVSSILYNPEYFEVFNIASGKSYSVRQVVELISKVLNSYPTVEYTGERRNNEVNDTLANIAKARNKLHWEPKNSLEEGLNKMILQKG